LAATAKPGALVKSSPSPTTIVTLEAPRSKFVKHVQSDTKINLKSAGWLLRVPTNRTCSVGAISLAASITLFSLSVSQAFAQNREKVIHTFKGATNDAGIPESGLIADGAGNLYGTALTGCGKTPPQTGCDLIL
jgi:hypothetical protein